MIVNLCLVLAFLISVVDPIADLQESLVLILGQRYGPRSPRVIVNDTGMPSTHHASSGVLNSSFLFVAHVSKHREKHFRLLLLQLLYVDWKVLISCLLLFIMDMRRLIPDQAVVSFLEMSLDNLCTIDCVLSFFG